MNRLWLAAAVVAANVAVAGVVALGWTFPALVAVVGVVVTIVVFQRPQRGLLILAFAMPFDGLRIPFHMPEWTSNWLEGMVFLTLAASIVARPGMAKADPGRAWPGWATAFAGLAILAVLSLRMVAPFQVLVGIKTAFQAVAVAYVAWHCPFSRAERDRLVSILMGVGAATAAWGLVQQGMGHAALRDMGYRYRSNIRFSGDFLRSFSTFIQPFPFAFFLMIVVLVGIPIALNDPGRLRNRVFLFLLPLYGLGMLVAVVRGAWIGTAAGLLWLGIRRHRILLLGIPIAMIVLALGPSTAGSNATSSRSGEQRVQTWNDSIYELGDHPFGIGIGTGGAAAQRINVLEGGSRGYGSEVGGDTAYQPDNQYFLYTLEFGMAGLWCFLLLLVAAFRTSVRTSERTSGDDSSLAVGTAAMIVSYAVAALVATILEIGPTQYYFWMLLGATSALAPDLKRGRVPAIALRPLPSKSAERQPSSAEPS